MLLHFIPCIYYGSNNFIILNLRWVLIPRLSFVGALQRPSLHAPCSLPYWRSYSLCSMAYLAPTLKFVLPVREEFALWLSDLIRILLGKPCSSDAWLDVALEFAEHFACLFATAFLVGLSLSSFFPLKKTSIASSGQSGPIDRHHGIWIFYICTRIFLSIGPHMVDKLHIPRRRVKYHPISRLIMRRVQACCPQNKLELPSRSGNIVCWYSCPQYLQFFDKRPHINIKLLKQSLVPCEREFFKFPFCVDTLKQLLILKKWILPP